MFRDYGQYCGVTKLRCPNCSNSMTVPVAWDPCCPGAFSINLTVDEFLAQLEAHVAEDPDEHSNEEYLELFAWLDTD